MSNLLSLNHTDAQALLALPYSQFSRSHKAAISYRLDGQKNNKWSKRQRGYFDKCMIAVSNFGGNFNGLKMCWCGHHGDLCKEPDYCDKCSLDQRAEPAHYEYGKAFDRAPFWYAFTMSSSFDPAMAGLKLVTRENPNGTAITKKYPLRDGLPFCARYTSDSEYSEMIERICKISFKFAKRLRAWQVIDGAYTTRELDMDFRPTEHPETNGGLSVMHTALAHGHSLVNSQHLIDKKLAIQIYQVYTTICQEENLPAWPDLEIKRVTSQKRLDGWLSYQVKSMPFSKWYNQAVVRGCALEDLNMAFSQTVFSGIKNAFGNARSPNKIGNMFCRAPGYVGRQIIRLNPAQIRNWLNNERTKLEHPEWKESVEYYLEKKRKQQGGGRHTMPGTPASDHEF